MKLRKPLILICTASILAFVLHTFISTGYFRNIENSFDGKILKKVKLYGAEDITINYKDSFAIVSSCYRKPFTKVNDSKNGLYFINLKDSTYTPHLLTSSFKKEFNPHGISLFKKDSTYYVYAINHSGKNYQQQSIEVFKLENKQATHIKTLKDASMVSPNDLVVLNENSIYFTNDHYYGAGFGKLIEDYLGLSISNVIHFNGTTYNEVANGIAYANGINFDAKRNLVFVASPRKFLVKVYQKNKDNSLTFIENIDCKTGVDNIEFDTKGNLWIGAHPNLLHFKSYMKEKKEFSPSEIIKINYTSKGKYNVENVYVNNGKDISGSTVATPFGNKILVGTVTDNNLLILQKNQ